MLRHASLLLAGFLFSLAGASAGEAALFGGRDHAVPAGKLPTFVRARLPQHPGQSLPGVSRVHLDPDGVWDYAIPVEGSCTFFDVCRYELVDGRTRAVLGRVGGNLFQVQRSLLNGRYTIKAVSYAGNNDATVTFYVFVKPQYGAIGSVSLRTDSYTDLIRELKVPSK